MKLLKKSSMAGNSVVMLSLVFMFKKLSKKTLFNLLLICGLGITLTSAVMFESSQSALAQSAVQTCVRGLVEVGVTPDVAASQCIQGGGAGLTQKESCIDRTQFKTYNGSPHKREDNGKTEYVYPLLNLEDNDCWSDYRDFFKPRTVCWTSQVRFRIASEEEAIRQCRDSSTSTAPQSNPTGSGIVIIKGQPLQNSSPAAIASCMDSLLYRTEERKPFSGWICVPNDVNCKTVRVRTEMSEATAIQACQNAR
jgi:hypothetical protein